MAVQVLLSFANDEQAKTFVQDVLNNPDVPILSPVQENEVQVELCGVWKEPTLFCDPLDGHRGKKTEGGYTRGRKYGWWVCGKCGKPSKFAQGSTKWELALGTNLLPAAICKGMFKLRLRNWESPVQWNFLLPADPGPDESSTTGEAAPSLDDSSKENQVVPSDLQA